VGALEAKEPSLFSGWTLGKCEWSTNKDCNSDTQLEAAMSWPELARARIQVEQAKWLGKTTGQIGELDESVKLELLGKLKTIK
jgi:hypothetical protein